MATPVIMPRQGQSVETCIITQWMKEKGDKVEAGDLLFSYETDKAAFDEESSIAGILLDVFYNDGDEVPVLTNVCVIGEEGESVDEFKPSDIVDDTKNESLQKIELPEKELGDNEEPPTGKIGMLDTEKLKISPRARKKAADLGLIVQGIKGSGPGGRVIESDIILEAGKQPFITPLARKKMEKDQLVYNRQQFSKGERVTSRDLLGGKTEQGNEFEIVPLSRMRKLIAENMFQSLRNSAQLTHHLSADARRILNLRTFVKPKAEESVLPNITLNDMVCYAVTRALKKHPKLNAHFMEDHTIQYRPIHLGFAVDTERGLMVPALKNADTYTLPDFAKEMKILAEKCQSGNIDPDLLMPDAATFTVSNLGAFGIEMFTPVINLPQVGILGVNTIQLKPADIGGGVIGFVPFIGLSLTYDHRAVDGAPASLFLRTIKEEIENFEETV